MPFAATHILVPVVLVSLIRAHWPKLKHKITIHEIFIAGLFGLLPDIDIPLSWINHYLTGAAVQALHRTYTHNFTFVIIIFAAAFVLFRLTRRKPNRRSAAHSETTVSLVNKKYYVMGLLATLGYASHIILDFLVAGSVQPFWPFSLAEFGLNLVPVFMLSGLDAVLLIFWVWHEEKFKKIRAFY
jgi:membrane-bound metal-dependent hydrolase YbcI (DUF457 family)